jgi:hypothetical protein
LLQDWDAAGIPMLKELLRDPDWGIREDAAYCLGKLGRAPEAKTAFQQLMELLESVPEPVSVNDEAFHFQFNATEALISIDHEAAEEAGVTKRWQTLVAVRDKDNKTSIQSILPLVASCWSAR